MVVSVIRLGLLLLAWPGQCLHERGDNHPWSRWKKATTRVSKKGSASSTSSKHLNCTGACQKETTRLEIQKSVASSTLLRPNFGEGPVFIKFHPYVKNLYAIDAGKSQFMADLVLTFQWKDPAVESVLPNGVKQLTIPLERARDTIWLPDMVVSNRVGSQQLISSSVMVDDQGLVQKVDRVVATLLVPFAMDAYPFDTQDLYVNVASSAYMSHDLKMLPMEAPNVSNLSLALNVSNTLTSYGNAHNASNSEAPWLTNATLAAYLQDPRALYVKLESFHNREYSLKEIKVTTYDDADSSLHKSRGRILMKVTHRYGGFLLSNVLPILFLQIIATGGFFFPVAGVFAMPRTTTVLATQLAAMFFGAQNGSLFPSDGMLTWVKTFNAVVQTQFFAFMGLQLSCLHAAHNLKASEAAHCMNEDCKMLVLPMCLIVNGLLFLPPLVQVPIPWHAGIMAFSVVVSYGALFTRVFTQMPKAPKLPDSAASP